MDGNYGQNQNPQDFGQNPQDYNAQQDPGANPQGWPNPYMNRPDQQNPQGWQDPYGNRPDQQNWQGPNGNPQGWQNPNGNPQGWQNPNGNPQNWQNPNMNPQGWPNPNMNQPNPNGYANGNGGYNSYSPNNYGGPIMVSNAAPQKTGGLAVGSLVCGIICIIGFWSFVTLILAIVGVVLGAVNNAQDNPNKGMAIAGIILNIVGFLFTILFIAVLMA